jgi:hypothetical protein
MNQLVPVRAALSLLLLGMLSSAEVRADTDCAKEELPAPPVNSGVDLAVPLLPEHIPAPGDAPRTSVPPENKDKCPIVNATLQMLNTDYEDSIKNPIQIFTAAAANMSCLSKIVSDIFNDKTVKAFQGNRYWDDLVAAKFDDYFFPNVTTDNLGDKPEEIQHKIQVHSGAVCFANSYIHYTGKRYCNHGQVYIKEVTDKNGLGHCEIATPQEVIDQCGIEHLTQVDMDVSFLRSSPISLLWAPGTDIEREVSFVDFPLRPTLADAWYTWKASARAPLLVYNPSHDGKITSGTQLFGPWSFGGKAAASLENGTPAGAPRFWDNGFEALGSLDRNRDGVVSGEELVPLALWFDRNQDGKSQAGEVVSLESVKVRALYYRNVRRDERNGNIIADLGFTREVNGRIENGSSVDWFADTAALPSELAAKHVMAAMSSGESPALSGTALPSLPETGSTAALAAADPLAGIWNWKYDGVHGGGEQPSLNYLLFAVQPASGELFGYTLSGYPLVKPTSGGVQGTLDFRLFTGSAKADKSGLRNIRFQFSSADSKLKSSAVLSADGQTLSGTTTAYISRNGVFKKFSYRWTARKVIRQ